jgi:hypothetical protein
MVICSFASLFLFVNLPDAFIAIILSFILVSVGVALPLWMLINTSYKIEDRMLIIKNGPLTWRVKLDSIKSVMPTRDSASSPALSMDRIRIKYGQYRSIMVSPEDKDNFLSEIKEGATRVA